METSDETFGSTLPGDANMDGRFDQQDIVQVLQAGKYLTGELATFAEGDWNRDGVFDQLDVVASLQSGQYLTYVSWSAHGAAHQMPFKGTLNSTAETVPSGDGFDATITGGGRATHLGRYTWSSTHHVSLGVPPFVVSDGDLTLTAANNDELFGTYTGTSEPLPGGLLSFTLVITIDGGTGRFDGAEGSITATGVVDTTALGNPSTATLVGSISSVGSNKWS